MKWIVQSRFEVAPLDNSRHDFVLSFSETENLPQLQLIHQKPDTAFVLLVGLVNIPESDRQKLKAHKIEQFNSLIWDIKLNLLRMEVDFTVLGSEKDPDAWEIQKRIFLNDANTSQFHEAYSKVKNALISIIWFYKQALDKTTE